MPAPLETIDGKLLATKDHKVYTAILNHEESEESNILTATILGENTIGGIVWSQIDTGVYLGILAGAFPENKVWAIGALSPLNNAKLVRIGRLGDAGSDEEILEQFGIGGNDAVLLISLNNSSSSIDLEGSVYIKIEVYSSFTQSEFEITGQA